MLDINKKPGDKLYAEEVNLMVNSINEKVTSTEGLGLSEVNFTTQLLNKLNGLTNYDDTSLREALQTEITRAIGSESNLQTAISKVASDLATFITGDPDADNVINRWQEVVSFLSGITEDKDLAGMLLDLKSQINQDVQTMLVAYYTSKQVDDAFVKKVVGSRLMTEEEALKLSGLSAVDLNPILNAIDHKYGPEDTYNKSDIDTKIEEARIALNLTQEQLASLNVNLTPITTELAEINLFPVKGKKLIVFGDSLSDAGSGSMDSPNIGQSWPKYVVQNLNLHASSLTIANGGACLRDKVDTTLNPNKGTWSASQNVLSNQVYALLDHYKRNKGTATEFVPDIMIVMIGTNDTSTSYPISNWDSFIGDWDSIMYNYELVDQDYQMLDITKNEDLTRYNKLKSFRSKFLGAYRWTLETLLTNFPNSMIYIMPPLHNAGDRGKNLFILHDYIRKIATYYSSPFIDVMGECGLSRFSENRKDKGWDNNWYTFDGTHPSFVGRPLIGNYIAQKIKTMYFNKISITAKKTDQDITKNYYTITSTIANADSKFGSITPEGATQVEEGKSLTVQIKANAGYRVSEILVDGSTVPLSDSYIFSNVTRNHTLIVTFEVEPIEPIPLSLNSISINDGSETTYSKYVTVKLNFSGTPTHYKLSESEDLSSIEWVVYSGDISFTLSDEYSEKTLYAQLKDNNIESEKKNASIVYQESAVKKKICRIGFQHAISNTSTVFDDSAKINKLNEGLGKNYILYDIDKKEFASLHVIVAGWGIYAGQGNITGDDSGLFPDIYLNKNAQWNSGYSTKDIPCEYVITLSPGVYKVKLFINSRANPDLSQCNYNVNGIVKQPSASFHDNFHDWSIIYENVEVTDTLTLKWIGATIAPINVVEIEEL